MSGSIEKSFEAEIGTIYEQLSIIKSVTADKEGDIRALKEKLDAELGQGGQKSQKIDSTYAFRLNKFNEHPLLSCFSYYNSLFWTNNEKKINAILSIYEDSGVTFDVSHRSYIKDIISGEHKKFRGSAIAIESIRSIGDGSFELGVGIESGIDALPVLALSSPIRSLMQPIIKKGYGFCITDKEGTTLFHSNIHRSLNENFLEETNGRYRSFITSDAEEFYQATYDGKAQYMVSRPMAFDELDGYYITTFADKQYVHTKNTIALYTTLLFYVVFLIVLALAYTVIYAMSRRTTKLKQRVFPLNWLKPYDTKKHHMLYKYLLLLNLSGIFYLVVTTIVWSRHAEYLINSMLFVSLLLLFFNFHILSLNLPDQKRIFSIYYATSNRVFRPLIAVASLILGCILWRRINYFIGAANWELLVLWDIVFLVLLVLLVQFARTYKSFNLPKGIISRLQWFKGILLDRKTMFRTYKAYLLTWILLFSVVPILILLNITYLKESEIAFKHSVVNYHVAKGEWENQKLHPYKNFLNDPEGKRFIEGLVIGDKENEVVHDYCLGAFQEVVDERKHEVDSAAIQHQGEDSLFNKLYSSIRVPLNQYGASTAGYVINESRTWSYFSDTLCYQNPAKYSKTHYAATRLFSLWGNINQPNILGFTILMIILIAAIVTSLVTFAIHRIFGLDFKKDYERLTFKGPEEFRDVFVGSGTDGLTKDGQESIINQLLYSKSYNESSNSYNNTIIIGVNASHISVIKNAYGNLKKRKYKFLLMDMYDIDFLASLLRKESGINEREYIKKFLESAHNDPKDIKLLLKTLFDEDLKKKQCFVVFIEHFEFAYNDPALNKLKIKILERLVDHESIAVNLSSEINPTNIYDYYDQEIRRIEKVLASKTEVGDAWLELRKLLQEFEVDYKKWLNLLGSFTKITLPLKNYESKEDTEEVPSSISDLFIPKVFDLLNSETNHGNFLYSLYPYFDSLDRINQQENTMHSRMHEDYILKVQETSYSYYFSIWNSLSKEERYIVYDIAKDKFVNTNNTDGIIELLNKGILIYDHSLRLMNESFSNFILSKVKSDEVLEKELESRKNGSWNKASAILILITVALFVFISFGQVTILNDINTLIGSLAAMFTLFLRVGGLNFKKN